MLANPNKEVSLIHLNKLSKKLLHNQLNLSKRRKNQDFIMIPILKLGLSMVKLRKMKNNQEVTLNHKIVLKHQLHK